MSVRKNPPFPRGATLGVTTTTDGTNIEGTIWDFEDISPITGIRRSGATCRCLAARNVSGVTLLAKQVVNFQSSGLNRLARFIGAAIVPATRAFPIDEYLPSTGVVANDICWLVVEGPAMCQQTYVADSTGTMPDGSSLVAATGAASTNTTDSGKVGVAVLAATSWNDTVHPVLNRIGFALSAKTSANTGTDVLVHVTKW